MPVQGARRRATGLDWPDGWVALTGTPGTGKTTVARSLISPIPVLELGALALQLEVGRRRSRDVVEVDLPRLRRAFRSFLLSHPVGVVVGHLAHFLPIAYIVVLRCHPLELARRLRKTRRSQRATRENVLSEALDVVLVEALAQGVPVREVDTTDRPATAVASTVAGLIRRRPAADYGRINWLADPRVTEELLHDAR